MKKILSFVLAFGMMLSLISIIPAQAAPTEDYPYIYEDFETDRGTTAGEVAKWVNEGAHGTNGALKFVQTTDVKDINVLLADPSILEGKFKMSAWVKVDTEKSKLKGNRFGFVFWGPATDTPDGKYDKKPNQLNLNSWEMDWQVEVDINALNRGEWVYVEKIVENWDGVMRHGIYTPDAEGASFRFAPRLGSPGDGILTNILAADSPTKEFHWYLDDFIIEPVKEPYGADADSGESKALVDVDFSESLSSYSKQISILAGFGQIEDGCFHFTSAGGSYNNIEVKEQPVKYNKIYKFSFRAKANDDETVGTMMKLIAIRGTKVGDTSKKDVNDPFYHYQFVRAMDAETGAEGKLTKEWKTYELYMTRQIKAAFHPPLSFNLRAYGPVKVEDGGKEAVDFMIDDLKFEELPTVTNGDFAWKTGDIPTTMEDSNMDNNDSKLYGTFYGWRDVGATSASVDGAAKVTVTAANGHIEQGVHIKNGSQNVIKFRAKGEGDSVGKSIQVKLDRDVANKDTRDVYNVETEVLGEGLVLTDEWQEYSIRYDLDVKAPAGANASAEPRSPYLSFVVDDGAAGLTYYVDDVVVEPYIPPYELPYATDLMLDTAPLSDSEVTFTYLYNNDSERELYEGNSVVRVLKKTEDGNYITLAQMSDPSGFYDYLVPAHALGSKLRFEVLPLTEPDENGNVISGAVYALETDIVKKALVVNSTLNAFDEESGSITGTLSVENNRVSGDNMDMFLAIVLYDANGGIVRYDSKPVSVSASATENISLSVSTANAAGLEPVAYAKAFTWNGSGIFDTDLTSCAETITVTR